MVFLGYACNITPYNTKESEKEFKVIEFNSKFLDLTYGIGAETYWTVKC